MALQFINKFTKLASNARMFKCRPINSFGGRQRLLNNDDNINTVSIIQQQQQHKRAYYKPSNQSAKDKIGVKVADLHEPAYLEDLKPKVGYYELLNLQIKGYDYAVLEKYQKYLHRTMKKLDFKVVKAWSAPHQELLLEALGDKTTAVERSYKIKIYERNIQMKDALVTKLPILIDIINMTSPPGVSFNIHRHTEEEENRRYFRDSVLDKLKDELQELKDTPLIGVTV